MFSSIPGLFYPLDASSTPPLVTTKNFLQVLPNVVWEGDHSQWRTTALRLHRDYCPRLNGRLSLILINPAKSYSNTVSNRGGTLSSICVTRLFLFETVQTLEGVGYGPSTISIIKNTIRFLCLFEKVNYKCSMSPWMRRKK